MGPIKSSQTIRIGLLVLLSFLLSAFLYVALPVVQRHYAVFSVSNFAPLFQSNYEPAFHLNDADFALQTPNTSDYLMDRRQASNSNNGVNGANTCGVGRPCSNGACCGQSGFCGFGPTYCGSGCSSNCGAKAPCGQYAAAGQQECPLFVCCSQWGFCGTTSDFCGTGCQSNCKTPSSPGYGGDVRSTVIGYYESWKATTDQKQTDTCGLMDPSQIPVEGLTHLNYAFAYIVPYTYDIVPMPGINADLFLQVTAVKRRNPHLKVYVSIGGWSFNDNNTRTQSVFGDVSSSLLKQARFAQKLTQFMVFYGFDGVDLDWEYPGAPDRGGNLEDVKNYPTLLQIIQYKFRVEKKSFGISITAPTSYWYLRWFNLGQIVKYVNFINLMSYDLHGIWDSTDPIGPYVYGHTNLTEIDQALSLFWRSGIDPSMLNLGLAFYGRSFELSDPSCITPGCKFSGPGLAGPCTATPGILSYAEIQDIVNNDLGLRQFMYDRDSGVNYLVYVRDGKSYWVSYDDKATFQQKIDFANARGLNGLLIWAVDMDDSTFTALKAVTGTDLAPTIAESQTLYNWNVNDCWITPCGGQCQDGFVKLVNELHPTKPNTSDNQQTGLNIDRNGNGCPNSGRNNAQRSLCCPPWGAPDPKTCSFRGTASECYGQCLEGEVLMATDNYGGGKWCNHGVKAYCCPATGVIAAVKRCAPRKFCTADLPQKIASIASYSIGAYCCPAQPQFLNCHWYGSKNLCEGNRCPVGQIEMTTDNNGDSGACVLGRQKALCCDPPPGQDAIIPVALGNLFPETLPAGDESVYYEAFDHTADEFPKFDSSYTDDPNKEPFAWTIMVGASSDVQSLRKRDGSHLEAFDCPNPEPSDYRIQRLKVVCMVEGDDNNCEDITIGSVRGTILRLPEQCGPDDYVRVVSFRQIEDFSLPSDLVKRAPSNHRVYEIRYDYNFRELRRDGGEVYVRFDTSTHPGYWNEIVSSSPTDPVRRGDSEDWREFHMAWFEEKLSKRGYGTTDSWWKDRFNALLNRNFNYGISKTYGFDQVLYSAEKNCAPLTTAKVEASVNGQLSVTMDYGLSLIGTLRNFEFRESYAYFNLYNLSIGTTAKLTANAKFSFQSQTAQLLDQWDPFGGSFNIKGLWTVGPYFDATAQVQALATISGEISAGAYIYSSPGQFTYMFPQSMNQMPSAGGLTVFPSRATINVGNSASITAAGSVTLTVTPSVGFQIQLDAFGKQLVNTKVVASFTNAMTVQVRANSLTCAGVLYTILYGVGVSIDLDQPLPIWAGGAQHFRVYGATAVVRPETCYPWSGSAKRSIGEGMDLGGTLMPRVSNPFGALFPDVLSAAIACPNNLNTPTGDCHVKVANYGDDPTDGGAIEKREAVPGITANENILEKRGRKSFDMCRGSFTIGITSYIFPPSSGLIADAVKNPFNTYGPLNPANCDDYGFGQVPTPPQGDSPNWATEHVLEWQLLKDFMLDYVEIENMNAFAKVDPSVKATNQNWGICQYMKFWWDTKYITRPAGSGRPLAIVAGAFPGTISNRAELVLLDKETNNFKEGIWATGEIRADSTMNDYIAGVDGDVNSAINACKNVMNAVRYMQDPHVNGILVAQATRVGALFDEMEDILAAFNDPTFNLKPYERLSLGGTWRGWMKNQYVLANAAQRDFLAKWVPKIASEHQAPGGQDTLMGGTEENNAIVQRITAMTNAYNAMPAWNDPFPASWDQ